MAEAARGPEENRLSPGLDAEALPPEWPFARSNLRLLDDVLDYKREAHRNLIRGLESHESAYGRSGPFHTPQLEILRSHVQHRVHRAASNWPEMPIHLFPVILNETKLTRFLQVGAIVPLLSEPHSGWLIAGGFGPFHGRDAQDRLARLVNLIEQQWQDGPLPLWGRCGLSIQAGLDIAPTAIQGHSEELPLAILILRECCRQKTGQRPFGDAPVFATGTIGFEGKLGLVDGALKKLEAFVRECGQGHPAILQRDQKRQLPRELKSQLGEIYEANSLSDLVTLVPFEDGLKSIAGPPTPEELPRLQELANLRDGHPGLDRVSRYLHSHGLLTGRAGLGQSSPDRPRLEGLTGNNMPGWKGETNHALVGRERELAELTDAFHDPACSIVCIIADGGYGKSSIVTRWMEKIRDEPDTGKHLNVQAGFAYSFYKQGWERQAALSSAPFFEECLVALSGKNPNELSNTGTDIWAREILDILRQKRSLLIMDGLEPNQASLADGSAGEIRDNSLKTFVKAITLPAGGLCIITSRIMPPELKGPPVDSGRVRVISLGALSHEASLHLLRCSEVRDDLDYWARESRGHPLLLALLTPAIKKGYDPKTFESHRVLIDHNIDNKRTIRNFVVSQCQPLGPAARAVLLSTCMFDKPVSYSDLRDLLLERAIIPKVTEPLYTRSSLLRRARFSENVFRDATTTLKKAAMLTVSGPVQNLDTCRLEVHPLIQAGVRDDLSENEKATWRKANWVIYKGMVRSVKPKMPGTRAELARLYDAVPHGINAGHARNAGWMYGVRCLRGFRAYSTNSHGMIGHDIALLSHYFEGNWERLKEDGVARYKYESVLTHVWAGTLLTAVNRWNEGWPLMERGLELAIKNRDSTTAARTARHLSLGHAIAGNLDKSESFARQSVELLELRRPLRIRLAEFAGSHSFSLVNLSNEISQSNATLGSVLHYRGRFSECETAFREAEACQRHATGLTTLRGLSCFREAEALLDLCNFDEADRMVDLAMAAPNQPPGWGEPELTSALLDLVFVRSRIRRADISGELRDLDTARSRAEKFSQLWQRQELRMDWLVPLFLVAQAGMARFSGEFGAAIQILDDAENRVAQFFNVLFDADVRIEQARVYLAIHDKERARDCVQKADLLSKGIGYGCKFSEIELLKGQLGIGCKSTIESTGM